MKITYIKLVNFANIKTAMKAKEIEIDFSKGKNKIVLITGPNGGGKTSMLSCLHPFANNGNLDVRNDNPLVIVGKDGYKEIHYQDGNDLYIIKHYYTHSKETHTIKSYIEKNGTELNPNGNQTSFKEIVKEELDIEPDYLKLVRLGNNVTNFIDHKATERKAFMGKILSEVDVYLKFFKKVNKDMIELKSVISHLLDKIMKLGITDVEESKKDQKKLKKRIEELTASMKDYNGQLSIIQHEFLKYDAPLVIREELYNLKTRQKKMEKSIDKFSRNFSIHTLKECEDMISDYEKSITTLTAQITFLTEKRQSLLDQADKLLSEKNTISRELEKAENSEQIKDTEKIIESIKESIDTRCKQYGLMEQDYPYSKKELEDLIILLDSSNDILYTTYEFGKEPVRKAIEFFKTRENINTYVKTQKETYQKNKLQTMAEFIFKNLTGKILPKPGCKNSSGCEVMEFYDKLYDLATEIPDSIVEDETFVTYTKLCHQNISTILENIKSKKELFQKLPKEIQDQFILDTLFDRMCNLHPLYDKTLLYAELSKVTEWELMKKDVEELKSNREKLKLLKSVSSNSDYFQNRKREISEELESIESDVNDVSANLHVTQEKLQTAQEELESAEELKEALEKKDSVDERIDTLQNAMNSIQSLMEEKKKATEQLDLITFEFNKLQNEYNSIEYRLQNYESYNKELKEYNQTYDDMTLVRSALSSKEGIPLLFIQIYLKNVQEITNELLEVIYGDSLSISDFIITADEFKIPYVAQGTEIKDVCYASQGERSFISLALSFALIYQAISRYNILLLDEIDATLDTENRAKFLQVLEKHINMIDGEQVFVISHNNMFNMYPVDVINTKNATDENNRLAHYIRIKKQ